MDAVPSATWEETQQCRVSRSSVSFRLAWIGRLLRSRFDIRSRTLGLTGAQWRMIAVISLNESATQSDVASSLEISNATAGRIIDRLEDNGWVERRNDLVDRRANRLFLTDAAAPMLERLSALGRDEESLALSGFSAAEKAQFAGFLDRLIDNMVIAAKCEMPRDCAADDAYLEAI